MSRVAAAALAAALLAACGGGNAPANNGAAAAVQAGGPVRTALAEFDRVCSQVMDRDGYVAAAPGAGWAPFEPAPDSPLGRLIALGQNMAREAGTQLNQAGEVSSENSAFRKTADGRELVLLVSEIQIPGMERSLECRVYDFTAPAPTDAEIAAWTSARPEKVNEQGITAYGWRPGFRQGFSRIDVTHLDPSSPLRAQVPVTGLSVTAFQGPTTD
jgi:hypothetical protein